MVSPVYEYQKKYIKAWYLKNKDNIDLKNKEIVKCDLCNKEIFKYCLNAHNKSKKHIKKVGELAT